MKTPFVKYQGAGNDFIILDLRHTTRKLNQTTVTNLCDRHTGIGADGLMTLNPETQGNLFMMRYWNCDGQESTMCGNGGRCIAHFAHSIGLGKENILTFNAIDGVHTAQIIDGQLVKLKMINTEIPQKINNNTFLINTGSPHYVQFVENTAELDLRAIAPEIRQQYNANVNFVKINADNSLNIRTWERGVENETLACGTGATAAALIFQTAFNKNLTQTRLIAQGGTLYVDFTATTTGFENIFLTGNAKKVFDGVIEIL